MQSKNRAVLGIYSSVATAEFAVDRLIEGGFSSGDVSVLLPDSLGSRDFAHHKETKAPEGTTTGVTAGGVVGGTLGLLAGMGTLAIPGLGPFIAAGPIMAGLAGVGVGGTVGGLIGALVGMGIPEYEAELYRGHIKSGGILLSVHCNTSQEIDRAKEILKIAGGEEISSSREASPDVVNA